MATEVSTEKKQLDDEIQGRQHTALGSQMIYIRVTSGSYQFNSMFMRVGSMTASAAMATWFSKHYTIELYL
jgi:hypothetical protein